MTKLEHYCDKFVLLNQQWSTEAAHQEKLRAYLRASELVTDKINEEIKKLKSAILGQLIEDNPDKQYPSVKIQVRAKQVEAFVGPSGSDVL